MLGRRSIRIKTMQSLFSLQTNPYLTVIDAETNLHQSIDNFIHLYHYIFYTFLQVANYVNTDAELKANKLLLQDDEREVSLKLVENEVVKYLRESKLLQTISKKNRFKDIAEQHVIRTLYNVMIENDKYQQYINNKITVAEDDFNIANTIITKIIIKNEVFQKNVEDHFLNFIDDYDFIYKIVTKTLNKAAKKQSTQSLVFEEDDFFRELKQFASQLLHKTTDKEDSLTEEINKYLKNWDASRLALVDIILLKMALCELLNFEEIPVKVTINEYIDISKQYSTPKSKDFINGVLDKMMKTLKKEGKIVKKGRGLK